MPSDPEAPYKNGPLDKFSLKERVEIRLADALFYAAIRLIGRTLRYQKLGWENFDSIAEAGHVPIYTFWHDRIFAGSYFFRDRGIVIMTSQSKDGEYIARFIRRLGYGAIRGSSSRGGSRALVEMIKTIRGGLPMGFTADGPRGPRYVAKPGPVMLAKKSGQPIMPFVVQPRKFWTVKSWDRTQIPKPFTQVAVIIGEPIYVRADEDVNATLIKLQASLDELTSAGCRWIETNLADSST